jgi:hypothetical protein
VFEKREHSPAGAFHRERRLHRQQRVDRKPGNPGIRHTAHKH